jgi:hypothetical protein
VLVDQTNRTLFEAGLGDVRRIWAVHAQKEPPITSFMNFRRRFAPIFILVIGEIVAGYGLAGAAMWTSGAGNGGKFALTRGADVFEISFPRENIVEFHYLPGGKAGEHTPVLAGFKGDAVVPAVTNGQAPGDVRDAEDERERGFESRYTGDRSSRRGREEVVRAGELQRGWLHGAA